MGFCDTRDEEINKFDRARMASLFSEHTGMTECIRVSLKLQSKITKQNTPSTSTILRKETSGKIYSHPIKTLKNVFTSDQDSGITG